MPDQTYPVAKGWEVRTRPNNSNVQIVRPNGEQAALLSRYGPYGNMTEAVAQAICDVMNGAGNAESMEAPMPDQTYPIRLVEVAGWMIAWRRWSVTFATLPDDDADDVKVNDYCDHDGAKCHHNCHPGRCFRAERGFGELSGIADHTRGDA